MEEETSATTNLLSLWPVHAGPPLDPESPRATIMKRAHSDKLRLCSAIEDIADQLPANVDRLRCLAVANTLVPLLRSIHRYEEDVVFAAFECANGIGGTAAHTIERLRAEHVEDACLADEITEALLAIGHGARPANPEALGYMLRAFFETVRRHVAFEREHILPVIGASAAKCGDRGSICSKD